jgi:hypothetical protein
MNRWAQSAVVIAAVVAMLAGAACIEFERVSNAPTSPKDLINSLTAGLWSSNGGINPNACGNFEWTITELTSTSAKGTFGATCSGGIRFVGNAEGTLNGSVVNWKADGNAQTSIGTCPFTVTGTATLEGDGVRVNYTANTCVGTFSGSELLRKH